MPAYPIWVLCSRVRLATMILPYESHARAAASVMPELKGARTKSTLPYVPLHMALGVSVAALAEEALAECLMLPAELSAMSRMTYSLLNDCLVY